MEVILFLTQISQLAFVAVPRNQTTIRWWAWDAYSPFPITPRQLPQPLTMDKTVSGVSTFLQLSWVSTVFVVSWLYTIFLSPFRAVGVAAWVITSPIRHALGYTWATAMAIVSYLVDEFEVCR